MRSKRRILTQSIHHLRANHPTSIRRLEQTSSFHMTSFSSKVPNDDKRALARAILEHKPADLHMHIPEQRFGTGFGKPKFPTLLPTNSLADLANKDCWFGMHQLHIDPEFMSLDVKEWATNAMLKKSEVNVRAMNVVNDCAECGVKLNIRLRRSGKE